MQTPPKPTDATSPPETAPEIGHNNPPPYDPAVLGGLESEIAQWADAAGEWLDLGEVETDAQAGHLSDFVAGANALKKRVEDARKAAKKPHDEAGRAVQAAFAVPATKIERAVEKAKKLLGPFLARKKAEAEAAKREAMAAAEKARKEAEEKARQAAARNDISGEVEAEKALKDAEKARKAASREAKAQVKSVSGGGRTMSLRTTRSAEITNINQVFMHYRDRPEVADLLTRLATADVRAKDVDETTIPGIRITETQTAA